VRELSESSSTTPAGTPAGSSSPEASAALAPELAPGASLTASQRAFTLTAVLLGTLLSALDQTIVATAGPQIIADLKVSPGLYDWIASSYSLASTVLVPVWGKLSDLHGRRPVLLAGLIVFLLASLGCGLAPNFLTLVAFRALQGAGAASLLTTALAVTADLYPPAVRGKYNGLFAAVWGLSSVAGPLLGGVITDVASWHWTFFINLPIGAVALAFIVARMPKLGGGPEAKAGAKLGGRAGATIDLLGVLLLCAAAVPLLLGLTLGRGELERDALAVHMRWGDPLVLGLLGAGVAGTFAFVASQRRSRSPILDLSYFADPVFRWGIAGTAAIGMAIFSGILFAPLFMQRVVGASSTGAGLIMVPLTLGLVIGNIASGQLVSRGIRYKPLMLTAASGLVVTFSVLAATLSPTITSRAMMIEMALLGLTMGPLLPLFALVIQNGLPARSIGSGTAVVTFFRQIGSTLGMALNGALFAGMLSIHAALPTSEAMTKAVAAVFWLGAALSLLGLAATIALPQRELRKSH
jgi:EmrB/QacA subfamily drug resistance transporter